MEIKPQIELPKRYTEDRNIVVFLCQEIPADQKIDI